MVTFSETRGEAGERQVSGAFKALSSIYHSGILAPGISCDLSILTVYVNRVNKDLTTQQCDRNENVKKTVLISKTTTSHVHHITFLCRFCTTMK